MVTTWDSPTAGRSTESSTSSHLPSRSKSVGTDEASKGSVPQRNSSYPVKPSWSGSRSSPLPPRPHASNTHRSSLTPICVASQARP